MAAVLIQRAASVVLVTGVAYFYQLFQESELSVSPEVLQLRAGMSGLSAHADWVFSLVWPPSAKSVPILGMVVLCFIFCVKRTFFSSQETEESRRVRHVKKRLLLAQMTQALRWNQDDSQEGEDEDVSAEDGKRENQKKEKKKIPPLAKDLFEMIYDDIEERHVTEYGIAGDQEPYLSTVALFKQRLAADFEDAVWFTNLARQEANEAGISKATAELDGDKLKMVAEFFDGTKLQELLDLYKKKVKKAFGRSILDKKLLAAAEECQRRLAVEQRKGAGMLWPLLRPLLPMYSLAILLMAFDSVVGCVTYNGLNTLLDGIAAGTMTMEELKWVTLQAYTKLVFCIFAHLSSWAIVGKVTSQFRLKVRNQIMANMVRQDMKFFDIFPSGILQERLNNDAEQLAGKMFHLPNRLVHHFFLTLSVSYTLYNLSRPLFLTVFAPIPFISCACYLIIRLMNTLGQRQRKIGEHVAANTMEVLKEIRTVREFAMEGEEADRFAANSAYRAEIEEYSSALHHIVLISPLVCLFDGVRFFCTYLGGSYVAMGTLTVGQAIQAGSLSNDLQHIVQGFFHIMPELVTTFQPLGRVCDILSMQPKIEPHPNSPPKLKPKDGYRGLIEFKSVDFTFPAEPQKQILHKLSFTISPGQKVGFVGATGSGKSTSIKLIERFYAPQAGEIFLDGRPISDYDVHHLRRHMSVVAQDNMLFSTTIRENIIYGLPQERRESITDEEIEDACKKANAWVFVKDFPRKLETYAGERGVKLSGGQKQRLAIARAVIRKPTILLLDEATSALDSKAEVVVNQALDKMIEENATGCTIIIAHRLTTVKSCDKIVVMDKGCIKESGPHDDLMKIPIERTEDGEMLRGWYHDLWETQHGKETNKQLEILDAENHQLKEELARLKANALHSLRLGHVKRLSTKLELPPLPNLLRAGTGDSGGSGDSNASKVMDAPAPLSIERGHTTPDW